MEFDAFQNYLEMERERRKTPREREIERELAELAEKYKRAYQAAAEPLMEELTKISMTKPPLPILHEGKIYEFVGPKLA